MAVRLPGPDGKHLEWHRSAAEAAEAAETRWIRIKANMALGAYEIFEALSENIPAAGMAGGVVRADRPGGFPRSVHRPR